MRCDLGLRGAAGGLAAAAAFQAKLATLAVAASRGGGVSVAVAGAMSATGAVAAAGIKALAFGLAYAGQRPDHYRIGFQERPGAGYSSAGAGFDALAPGAGPAVLPVSVHRLPRESASYLTERCDAAGACEAAEGGEAALTPADMAAATGYLKAPNAGAGDGFGALALSADGGTLAVGASLEDSSATGAFAPGDPGYRSALEDDGAGGDAAYVYRRSSSGRWSVEAYLKAPNRGGGDWFGHGLKLSAGGGTLAVGAPFEAGGPEERPRGAAGETDDSAPDAGAVYLY